MEIFGRIRLAPAQYRTVGIRRFEDAQFLVRHGGNERANAAIYLPGFCVKCLLKYRLALAVAGEARTERFWRLLNSHDLEGLWLELRPESRGRVMERGLQNGLRSVFAWSVHARYSPKQETMGEARVLVDHVREIRRALE